MMRLFFLAWMMSMTMPIPKITKMVMKSMVADWLNRLHSKLMLPFFSMDSRSDYPRSANGDYQDGDEINGGRLAKPQDFPW